MLRVSAAIARAIDAPRRQLLLPDSSAAAAFAHAHQIALSRQLSLQTTRQRKPGQTQRRARHTLWKRDVKSWLAAHDLCVDWELPEAEERQLVDWFSALDADGSGEVDAEGPPPLASARSRLARRAYSSRRFR